MAIQTNGNADIPAAFYETGKLTKRKQQALNTKNRIYNIAVKEINEKGINNVSIEDITRAAKVAKGTFYTHFDSKEALVYYTYEQSDMIYQSAYEQVRDLEFLYQVTCFAHISYVEYEKRGKGIIKAMISNYFSAPERNFYNKDRLLIKCLEKIVEKGKLEGVLDQEKPTDQYVNILVATLAGVEVMWCFDTQGQKLADMIEEAVGTVAKGMMKTGTYGKENSKSSM